MNGMGTEEKNTQWRRKKIDTAVDDGENIERKKTVEIYNPSVEILPVLEGPETINTSIPSTTPMLQSFTPTPQYNELTEDASPITQKEGFKIIDTSSITDVNEIKKNPFKWFSNVVMFPIKYAAQLRPKIITHNKYTNRFLNYLAEKDIANGWLDKASFYAEKKDKLSASEQLKQLSEKAKNANLDNVTTESVDGALSQLTSGLGEVCDNVGESEEDIQNRLLALDKALIKDYMFKTILLLLSFLTVNSWAYLFLVVYNKDAPFLQKVVETAITDSGTAVPNVEDVVPGSGPIAQPILSTIYYFLNIFKPFDMATRGVFAVATMIHNLCATDMNKFYDKKIWYILILYGVFMANVFFLEKYENYMKDIVNFKPNTLSSMFYGIFILYYIYDVVTYPFSLNNILEMTIGSIFTIFFLLFLLLRNIFVLVCVYYNQFLVVFALLMLFIIISFFGLTLYPSFNPSKMFERIRITGETINKDVEEKLKLDEMDPFPKFFTKIYRFIRNVLHFAYDNLFFISAILWILHMYRVFDKELKYDLLRMNVFTMLCIGVLILILIKFVHLIFFSKKNVI